MHRQTESALEAANVVFEEVRILFQVDVFESELAQPFAPVGVGGGVRGDAAAAELGACTVLLQNPVSFRCSYESKDGGYRT